MSGRPLQTFLVACVAMVAREWVLQVLRFESLTRLVAVGGLGMAGIVGPLSRSELFLGAGALVGGIGAAFVGPLGAAALGLVLTAVGAVLLLLSDRIGGSTVVEVGLYAGALGSGIALVGSWAAAASSWMRPPARDAACLWLATALAATTFGWEVLYVTRLHAPVAPELAQGLLWATAAAMPMAALACGWLAWRTGLPAHEVFLQHLDVRRIGLAVLLAGVALLPLAATTWLMNDTLSGLVGGGLRSLRPPWWFRLLGPLAAVAFAAGAALVASPLARRAIDLPSIIVPGAALVLCGLAGVLDLVAPASARPVHFFALGLVWGVTALVLPILLSRGLGGLDALTAPLTGAWLGLSVILPSLAHQGVPASRLLHTIVQTPHLPIVVCTAGGLVVIGLAVPHRALERRFLASPPPSDDAAEPVVHAPGAA